VRETKILKSKDCGNGSSQDQAAGEGSPAKAGVLLPRMQRILSNQTTQVQPGVKDMASFNIEKRAWHLRVEDGRLILYTPDGIKVPEQIDCSISQPLDMAMRRPRVATVTVSMLVILDESVPVGESKQLEVVENDIEE
jgi:hypothetical protein